MEKQRSYSFDQIILYNRPYLIIVSLQCILFLYQGITGLQNEIRPLYIIDILLVISIVVVVWLQPFFIKKFGKRGCHFSELDIQYKDRYFGSETKIKWADISLIKFSGVDTFFHIDSTNGNTKKLHAPLDIYLDLRKEIESYANLNTIKIEKN